MVEKNNRNYSSRYSFWINIRIDLLSVLINCRLLMRFDAVNRQTLRLA